MSEIAFPRSMRVSDPTQLARALDENMRYLERLLNATFDMDHDRLSNVTASQHHSKYLDSEVDAIVATHDAITDAHHAKYTDGEVDTIVATHAAVVAAHHAKYTDSDAVTAMGVLGDGNALNHTKFAETGWATDWTPAAVGGLTIGNGTISGRYKELDDIVIGYFNLIFGTTTAITGGVTVDLPVTASSNYVAGKNSIGTAFLSDFTGSSYAGVIRLAGTGSMGVLAQNASGTYLSLANLSSTIPFTWNTTDRIAFSFAYEGA